MRWIVVRHTRPHVEAGVCYGQTDVDLGAGHREQILSITESLAPRLGDLHPTVVTSPLRRCALLADELACRIGLPGALRDRDAMELSFGDWEGRRWDEIDAAELDPWMEDWKRLPAGGPGSGGEALTDLLRRVSTLIDRYRSCRAVVLVGHAGVIRSMMHLVNGVTLDDAWSTPAGYGEVLEFAV